MQNTKKYSVLILDDEQSILNSLSRELHRDNYNLLTATSGEEGLELLRKNEVALVISDYRMPGMDGVEFMSRARQISPEAARVMLTGYADMNAVISAVNSGGISGYLVKPWDADELREVVRKAISKYHGKKEGNRSIMDERRRNRRRIEQQLSRLTALRAINLAISSSLELRITLGVLLDQVFSTLQVDGADILLYNPNTLRLEFNSGRGFYTKALQHTNLRIGEGNAGRAALENKTIYVKDLKEDGGDILRSPYLLEEKFQSYLCVPLVSKGNIKGVLELFYRRHFEPDAEFLDFVEAVALQAAIALDNAVLFNDLQKSNIELKLAYETTIEGWARALDLRDKETEGHSRRVTEMTARIARELGMNDSELVHVRRGALLHDIGKMGIPDSILLKPGPLTEDEWVIMRKHPVYAYELLTPIEYLHPAIDIPYCHHEKWDGSGYPRGLKGDDIPLAARIFSIVDVYDALTSDRPYRKAWSSKKALEYINTKSGKDFDPKILNVFLDIDLDQVFSCSGHMSAGELNGMIRDPARQCASP